MIPALLGTTCAYHVWLTRRQRRNGAVAEDFARRHGVPRFYTDAAALLDDAEVDAVYIGKPHVWTEYYIRSSHLNLSLSSLTWRPDLLPTQPRRPRRTGSTR